MTIHSAYMRAGNPDLYAQTIAHAYFAGYRIYDPSTAAARDPDLEAKMMRFPAIAAPLAIRHHSISGRRGVVVPPDDATEKDKALAKVVGKIVDKIRDFDKAKLNLARADVTGARYAKVVKRAIKANFGDGKERIWVVPHHLEDIPKENFRWAPDRSTEEPRAYFEYARKRAGRVVWMRVPPGAPLVRHVVNDSEEMLGYGRGLRDILSHLFTAMSRCFIADVQAADRFGHGWLHLKLNHEADGTPVISNEALVDQSQTALNRMRADWNFITGQGDELEILGPPSSATDFMGKLTERLERMTDRVIMGASLFGGGGSAAEGSYGRAETEADTSTIIFDACTGFLEDSITNDIIVNAIIRDNPENFRELGLAGAENPKYEIVRGRKQDPKEAADRLEVVLRSGASVVKDEYYDLVQLSVPGDDDDVVAGNAGAGGDVFGLGGLGGDEAGGGFDANGEPLAAPGLPPPNTQEISLALERSIKNGDRLTANITRKKLWAAMGEEHEAPDISDEEWEEMGAGGEQPPAPGGGPDGEMPPPGGSPGAPPVEMAEVGASATLDAGILPGKKRRKAVAFREGGADGEEGKGRGTERSGLIAFAWDESAHPRNPDGTFKSKDIAVAAASEVIDELDPDEVEENAPDLLDAIMSAQNQIESGEFGFDDLAELANAIEAGKYIDAVGQEAWSGVTYALTDQGGGAKEEPKGWDDLEPHQQKAAAAIYEKSQVTGETPESDEGKALLEIANNTPFSKMQPIMQGKDPNPDQSPDDLVEPHPIVEPGKDTSKTANEINEEQTLEPMTETITRNYKGKDHVITAKDGKYEYEGKTYGSLTAVAKEITGYKSISGPAFFKTAKKQKAKPDPKGIAVINAGGPPPEFKGWNGGDHVRVLDETGKIRDVRVVKQLPNGNALLLDQASGSYYESPKEGVVAWLKNDDSPVKAEPKTELSPTDDLGGMKPQDAKTAIAAMFGKDEATRKKNLNDAYLKLKQQPAAPPPDVTANMKGYPSLVKPIKYKQSVRAYTGAGYGTINNALRNGSASPATLKSINNIGRSIDSQPSWDPPRKLLRGTGVTGISKALGIPGGDKRHVAAALKALADKGGAFTLNGFQSTSTNKGTASAFKKTNGMIFEMTTPKGLPVKTVSSHSSENEVLLGHGWHYKPTGVRYDKSIGSYVVAVDVVPQPHKDLTNDDLKKMAAS